MPNSQKEKGKRWERDCAEALTEAFGENFMRVPNSGSFTGGSNASRMERMSQNQISASRGDLIPPEEWVHFIAECKHVKPGTVSDLMQGPSAKIEQWWRQANADARDGDFVVLLVKEDRKSPKALFDGGLHMEKALRKSWMLYRGEDSLCLIVADMADWLENCEGRIRKSSRMGVSGGIVE